MTGKKYRIGIDVGGTFTDAAVIDNDSFELIAKKKIPTTHHHPSGVAHGIITIIHQVLEENGILPQDVSFIAHGTTQATNALLEGDVAKVGILAMGSGLEGKTARKEANILDIPLADGKFLHTFNAFVDTRQLTDESIRAAIVELRQQGAEVIVASEAYSVDDPTNELRVMAVAAEMGISATGGHEITQLYGLKTRTRTAVVNASLIPRMLETANMTEQAIKEAGIGSQLMIMRCDGGVMSIDEVRKRPILTMLSGLAAGVAGALMYEKVSDGIFFEVGGTSVDISVIKNGKVMIQNAQVGGHRTYLRSLDVRTLAVAGGSMIMVDNGNISMVGPRSAHIAGCEYECFITEAAFGPQPALAFISPRPGDPQTYAVITGGQGKRYALTLAGAANLLGYIPADDYAAGNVGSARLAWQLLGDHLGISADQAARQALDIAIDKVMGVVDEMISEYKLERHFITLVGGGGSGCVLVPAMAEKAGMKHKNALNAPFISTIGVGMAMVREMIEKSVVNPGEAEIRLIRAEIMERIVKSGANEATVDINIEIDKQKNVLRAIATGATELRQKESINETLPADKLQQIAAESVNLTADAIRPACQTGRWHLFEGTREEKRFFGLLTKKKRSLSMLDREGVVRLKKENANWLVCTRQQIATDFAEFLDDNTRYSEANAAIPKTFLFWKEKMLDLSGTQTKEQLLSLIEMELDVVEQQQPVIAVAWQ
ncbi:hydantoinase/oxoprolinase family protein [Biostraticola tofi]|uniref:N-methylhydantoinase A/oxoprolinase/acetone carboxylase beta subunit n=1 Tax=Biostraticola tofi TaxID=466109 RepID=A0A4R3YW85_9GAMM|nr:hydantoinase/oxoprolinase family protein [Biostraticola tofi]TCV96762.1 N-methylhydantoinase A/oxoprolinase/acetone carboxylase beta subunit [Biostraticola tofi]